MNKICIENNAKFMVFSIYGEKGTRKGKVGRVSDLANLDRVCRKYKIPLIWPARKYHMYNNDGHINGEGNANMAKDIIDFLVDREFL